MRTYTCVRPVVSYSTCFTIDGDRLLRTSAVAKRIGRTRRMVRIYIRDGHLKAVRKGKFWLCKASEVEGFLRQRNRGLR
jgi:excisionase family DNA binding protein